MNQIENDIDLFAWELLGMNYPKEAKVLILNS